MSPLDALWHLLNFFGPAAGVGAIGAAIAKLVWRRELRGARWSRLAWISGVACALVSVVGLVVFGRDGAMATYGAMVLASALSLFWVGFGFKRG